MAEEKMTIAAIKAMFIPGDKWHLTSIHVASNGIAHETDLTIVEVLGKEIHTTKSNGIRLDVKIPKANEIITARPGYLCKSAVNGLFELTLEKKT